MCKVKIFIHDFHSKFLRSVLRGLDRFCAPGTAPLTSSSLHIASTIATSTPAA